MTAVCTLRCLLLLTVSHRQLLQLQFNQNEWKWLPTASSSDSSQTSFPSSFVLLALLLPSSSYPVRPTGPLGSFSSSSFCSSTIPPPHFPLSSPPPPPGIPIKTTLDNASTVQYAGLIHQLVMKARSTVRDIDPQNDLTFLRVRSKKNEVMIAPGRQLPGLTGQMV